MQNQKNQILIFSTSSVAKFMAQGNEETQFNINKFGKTRTTKIQ